MTYNKYVVVLGVRIFKWTYKYDDPVAFARRLLMLMYTVDPEPPGRLNSAPWD